MGVAEVAEILPGNVPSKITRRNGPRRRASPRREVVEARGVVPEDLSAYLVPEAAGRARVPRQGAAGRDAGDRAQQLDRVANGVGDRVDIRVPDVAPPGVVPGRGVDGWMEPDRHAQLLQRVPQRIACLVVQVLAVDRVRRADDR